MVREGVAIVSSVTGVVLCCSISEDCESADDAPPRFLAEINQWLADRAHRDGPPQWELVPVDEFFGGAKHPQISVWGGGFNHFPEDDFAAFIMSLDWRCPENVVLILNPEDGPARVLRPWSELPPVPDAEPRPHLSALKTGNSKDGAAGLAAEAVWPVLRLFIPGCAAVRFSQLGRASFPYQIAVQAGAAALQAAIDSLPETFIEELNSKRGGPFYVLEYSVAHKLSYWRKIGWKRARKYSCSWWHVACNPDSRYLIAGDEGLAQAIADADKARKADDRAAAEDFAASGEGEND